MVDGRENPKPEPQRARGTGDLSNLNIAKGTRIRVLQDNGRRGLVGLEGVVVQTVAGGVVVELENDPAIRFRLRMNLDFHGPSKRPLRYFRVTEVERIQPAG